MGKSRHIWPIAATLVFCWVTQAAGQVRHKEAETAFQLGKQLMTQGNYDEACRQFETSLRLSPRASVSLCLDLPLCFSLSPLSCLLPHVLLLSTSCMPLSLIF